MIDTHCHLALLDYQNRKEVLFHMNRHIMIASGVDKENNEASYSLSQSHSNIYCTLGYGPDEVRNVCKSDLLWLEEHCNDFHVVGIGEIGLDYHNGIETMEEQKELFCTQLKIASKYHKTVVIHSRDAISDTYEIMRQFPHLSYVLHCYSGSLEMAQQFLKMNVMFGIGGVLTFKNAKRLKAIVSELDLSCLLLETDSPYLTPEPFRGQKNEPYNIIYVALEIAKIKGLSVQEVLSVTTRNAVCKFDLPCEIC